MTEFPSSNHHHELKTRSWCDCGEWCYLKPNKFGALDGTPCACCQVAMAEQNPCPHCDGTGVAS